MNDVNWTAWERQTWLSKLWQQIFCGSDLYFQSMFVRWWSNEVAGIPTTSRLIPSTPDSSSKTLTRGSSESRLASTQPAVPAPTTRQQHRTLYSEYDMLIWCTQVKNINTKVKSVGQYFNGEASYLYVAYSIMHYRFCHMTKQTN